MIRCTICKLETQRREAIDVALQGGVSLIEIATSSGLSKSSLQRHSKHMTTLQKLETPTLSPVVEDPILEPLALAALTKESLLSRIEYLWQESLDGLAVSKRPIMMTRSNGSTVEVPGDLRARVGFIREAKSILELRGAATGELVKSPPNQVGQVLIVCPAMPAGVEPVDCRVIDILPGRR
jgi:hypothetical protein